MTSLSRSSLLIPLLVWACLSDMIIAQDSGVDLSVLTKAGTPFIDGDRLICFGDSITWYGAGPDGYVTLLGNAFAAAGHPSVKVIPGGVPGHTVVDLQGRLQREVIEQHPTIVFIYIGINDIWHHNGDLGAPKDHYDAGLRDIISRLHSHGIAVVLATATVIGEKPDGTNKLDKALDIFQQLAHRIGEDLDVEVCDLRAAFLTYLKSHNPQGLEKGILTVDGIHLTPAGNLLVAQEAAKSLVAGMIRAASMPQIHGDDFESKTTATISLRDAAGNQGLSIHYTLDGGEPTATSPTYRTPIPLSATATITARSFRQNAPVGIPVSFTCTRFPSLPAETPHAVIPGLDYAYYEGPFALLPDFAKLTPSATGRFLHPDLSIRKREENYALRFTGFLDVPESALYTFSLSSDDGSRLTFNDHVVVDNDGVHGMGGDREGRIALAAGKHRMVLDYFQGGGGQGLEVYWSTPHLAKQLIPTTAWSTTATP